MKRRYPAFIGFKVKILASFTLAVLSCTLANSQPQNVTLLVQQSPSEGGATEPVAGSYKYAQDSEVTLSATPKQGYKFVYWLGDVSDPTANSTVVRLDKPKIVIAVFEQIDNSQMNISSPGGGGGGLVPTALSLGMGGGISGGGSKPQVYKVYSSGDKKPPVIPEPATVVLLTVGSVLVFTKRRIRKTGSTKI
jgi:hypothetical protein